MRGWVYAAAETGGLLTALAGELQRSNLRKDYLVLQDAYDHAVNGNEAVYYRGLAGPSTPTWRTRHRCATRA